MSALATPVKPKKVRAPRQKNDATFIKAARELRDRYIDEISANRLLPGSSEACAKYDVSRQLTAGPQVGAQPSMLSASNRESRMLDAA